MDHIFCLLLFFLSWFDLPFTNILCTSIDRSYIFQYLFYRYTDRNLIDESCRSTFSEDSISELFPYDPDMYTPTHEQTTKKLYGRVSSKLRRRLSLDYKPIFKIGRSASLPSNGNNSNNSSLLIQDWMASNAAAAADDSTNGQQQQQHQHQYQYQQQDGNTNFPKSCLVTKSKSSRSVNNKETARRRVYFTTVQVRYYERILDIHPSTSSGASIALGWSHTSKSPQPFTQYERLLEIRKHSKRGGDGSSSRSSGDNNKTSRHHHTATDNDDNNNNNNDNNNNNKSSSRQKVDFLLSEEERQSMLQEWGFTTYQIKEAARLNKKLKEQRKKTWNNLTAQTMVEKQTKKAAVSFLFPV